ncbi:gastrula zinc finger protein XlCGF57.1-like [Galleria mellonella]|uniref:Gastrula zinc finger protein XlCGF57.1-like n=1 Tax=Galleria mellonella TaxID=7137 RepID=A0A6J1WMH6_GALME|nr:gastrula zinc finger protein XlCGF57.1-like [Galleria mellonella]
MDLKICRICCENKGNSYIYDKINDELVLSAKIMYCCANISIYEGDGLPAYICNNCELELSTAYHFIKKCETTDKALRSQDFSQCSLNINKHDNEDTVQVKIEENIGSDQDLVYGDIDGNFDITCEVLSQEREIKNESKCKERIKRKVYKKRTKFKSPASKKCTVCNRKCPNPSTLMIHMRSHSDEKPYPCSSCDKKYKDSGTLKRHVERNHSENRERNFTCENCGKCFYSKSDVKIHMRIHTGETPYACSECPMKFTQISALLRHIKRHTGEKPYMCATCSKAFCSKEELKNHHKVHSNNKQFSCAICNVMFKYRNNLKKHLKLHSEPDHFICSYCGRNFNLKGNLKSHIERQHSEKSGYCNICSKNVPNIEVHTWKHTGEKPLKCELCTSSFGESRALAHHMNFRHKKTDKHKCLVEGCLMAFPSRPMLDFHTAKLHDTRIPFPCDQCSRGFYRKSDLARHKMGTHKERLVS